MCVRVCMYRMYIALMRPTPLASVSDVADVGIGGAKLVSMRTTGYALAHRTTYWPVLPTPQRPTHNMGTICMLFAPHQQRLNGLVGAKEFRHMRMPSSDINYCAVIAECAKIVCDDVNVENDGYF